MTQTPPGWHPDPQNRGLVRYWDGSQWTEHCAPAPTAVAAIGPPAPTGNWYFVITLLSCGLLASVPFFHAASRLERPQLHKVGAGMAAATLLTFVLVGVSPTEETGQTTGWPTTLAGFIMMAVMLVATLLLIGLRRDVYNPSVVAQPPTGNQGAMASIEATRRKRSEARVLAAKDPMMARELGIGRPGSNQGYDDGGLLDLNCATADQFYAVCGIPRNLAEEVVAARAALGRFVNVEDVMVFGQIGEEYAPMVRERGIIIADR